MTLNSQPGRVRSPANNKGMAAKTEVVVDGRFGETTLPARRLPALQPFYKGSEDISGTESAQACSAMEESHVIAAWTPDFLNGIAPEDKYGQAYGGCDVGNP